MDKQEKTSIPVVLISGSHQDERWRELLHIFLKPFARTGNINILHITDVDIGADPSKIVSSADIVVLLISPAYLASDFAVQNEIPALLRRHRKGDIIVLPVVVSATPWTLVPGFAELQFANDPSQPLDELSEQYRNSTLVQIAERIAGLSGAIKQRRITQESISQARETPSRTTTKGLGFDPDSNSREFVASGNKGIFISHAHSDGDFAELLKSRLEGAGYTAWIDIDRLTPGLDWRNEIDTAIRSSLALVAVMSPEARNSEYVTYEWAFAVGSKTQVIPIMLRETSFHPRLATLQYLDFSNRISRPWPQLLSTLEKIRIERET